VSPLLKNAIDWVSRPLPDESGKVPYKGKVVAMMSVSITGLGGSRGLANLRQIFTTLGSWVLPEQLGMASATDAFADDGSLRDAAHQAGLEALAAALVDAASRIGTTAASDA
jgi:NAD(P)H-dependent FMN reductase